MGSQFPDQGSNLGHGNDSSKPQPLGHHGTPHQLNKLNGYGMGYSSNNFGQVVLCQTLGIQKRNNTQSLPLGYMVKYPLWSVCGLQYDNKKYTYIFVVMDTDLCSEHTPHTELSLSATQTLLTPHSLTEPVAMVTHIKGRRVLGAGIISVQSIKSNQGLGTSPSNCLKL